MTERGQDDLDEAAPATVCPVCGATHQPGDRFCAQCGAPLTAAAATEAATASVAPTVPAAASPTPVVAAPAKDADQDGSAWIFAAPPRTVAGAGVLLLLLAALLLAVGQLEPTGTIVMLSFCAAPLGLIVILIGLARFLLGRRA